MTALSDSDVWPFLAGLTVTLHSDQGSTYAPGNYQEIVNRHGIRQRMSRKGDCRDNAPMKSFFHTLKTELAIHCDNETRDDARVGLFDYMEVFYNRQRRHSLIIRNGVTVCRCIRSPFNSTQYQECLLAEYVRVIEAKKRLGRRFTPY